ncbi:MAG: hypothetical protein M3Q03_16175 [Chloroflexota bacterium]|nr:hypothetical protein [Chloroflexota bacterium]
MDAWLCPRIPGTAWGYYARPYPAFGCLYTILLIVLIWFLLSLFIDALVFW